MVRRGIGTHTGIEGLDIDELRKSLSLSDAVRYYRHGMVAAEFRSIDW